MNSVDLMQVQQFHFLRPGWLLAIPFVLVMGYWLIRHINRSSGWHSFIAPSLLPFLLDGKQQQQQRWPLWGVIGAWVITCLALAGPTWSKLPLPIHKTETAQVILLDLSPSMNAEDLKPSRLVRARMKILDLLEQRKEGLTALVAYAGEAHVVTPLTDDTETIRSLVPILSPQLMPRSGSNVEMAVQTALQLLTDAQVTDGELLLVTDGVTEDAVKNLNRLLPNQTRLSILGIGTESGAPIPIPDGGFARDNGAIIIAKLDTDALYDLATAHDGLYRSLTTDDSDIRDLQSQPELLKQNLRQLKREFDIWQDMGSWLGLLLLPLALASFRKGWILSLVLTSAVILTGLPQPALASGWTDFW